MGDIIPNLHNNSLISTTKLAIENYHMVFMPTEVLVFDENDYTAIAV
jgi:hypothetical protein